jgi:hypothetical protein
MLHLHARALMALHKIYQRSLLSECRDEADVGALIVAAVPRLRAGELVEIKPPSESRLRVIPGWRA